MFQKFNLLKNWFFVIVITIYLNTPRYTWHSSPSKWFVILQIDAQSFHSLESLKLEVLITGVVKEDFMGEETPELACDWWWLVCGSQWASGRGTRALLQFCVSAWSERLPARGHEGQVQSVVEGGPRQPQWKSMARSARGQAWVRQSRLSPQRPFPASSLKLTTQLFLDPICGEISKTACEGQVK